MVEKKEGRIFPMLLHTTIADSDSDLVLYTVNNICGEIQILFRGKN